MKNLKNASVGGEMISPVLDKNVKNYLIDIDGTVTEDVPNEQPERMEIVEPFPDAVESCNAWYDEGHIITFFTSRTEETREVTEKWLRKHGFKFHALLMNKPRGGNYHWIDNHEVKATKYTGRFTPTFKQVQGTVDQFDD
ncbi:MAG: phosphoheptose isomerase [Bacteroidia bacterium]|nr:phosphoheptose isomerase [Bacteroidia bacterium]